MYKVTVSSRGQIAIPVEAKKKLDIKDGDVLQVQVEDSGRIILRPNPKEAPKKKGIVAQTAGLLKDMDMTGKEFVENIRSNKKHFRFIEGLISINPYLADQ